MEWKRSVENTEEKKTLVECIEFGLNGDDLLTNHSTDDYNQHSKIT